MSCSSSKLYLGKEAGSLYTTSELRRNPSDNKLISIEGKINKRLKNNFYLIEDETGLVLGRLKPELLGEDTSFNKDTIFRFYGETENEGPHFHIKIDEVKNLSRN